MRNPANKQTNKHTKVIAISRFLRDKKPFTYMKLFFEISIGRVFPVVAKKVDFGYRPESNQIRSSGFPGCKDLNSKIAQPTISFEVTLLFFWDLEWVGEYGCSK